MLQEDNTYAVVWQDKHKNTNINTNESRHSEMDPVRQNPFQRTVRTAHLSLFMTVHNFSTKYSTEQFWQGGNIKVWFTVQHTSAQKMHRTNLRLLLNACNKEASTRDSTFNFHADKQPNTNGTLTKCNHYHKALQDIHGHWTILPQKAMEQNCKH